MEIVIFNIAEPRKDRTRPNFFSDPNSFKTKKANLAISFSFVIPLGFEPRTHTLKVYCSTS
ncbi:hypothetical protein SPHINGO8BC_51774 [Sphingobacterium multivorum]|jgi:hypothetical protein|uniref:Uncharacterized protein n=1 Tax=Sphingobacterium multivorum TaxID=28454 RepID=A0A654DAD2_SPHMU|nr:hypothetical protein SPHINGO8BC_51774 [Sphingobacterium multivorum]